MRKLLIRILCATVTFSIGVGIYKILHSTSLLEQSFVEVPNPPTAEPALKSPTDDWTSFSDLLTEDDRLNYNGYLIERRYKSVKLDVSLTEDQGYVVFSKNGKFIRSFDGMVYSGLGNIAEFGLFSFLGTNTKQLAISQDVFRGGKQWIVDLSGKPRVIFDGDSWGVGRESGDSIMRDIDGDDTFEISLPITDFYSFMDKMSVSQCPLPSITFKYDSSEKRYVPISHLLNELNSSGQLDPSKKSDEFYTRSMILDHTLELIYGGKRDQAWQYFNTTYNLDDKKEFERRVKDILRDQPVYKYIYKNS